MIFNEITSFLGDLLSRTNAFTQLLQKLLFFSLLLDILERKLFIRGQALTKW